MGTRRGGVGINMYINNHLGFIFLGNTGGTLGLGGGLGDKEKGSRYQHLPASND